MKKSLFALLAVVFIDGSGIGILFPILNSILINTQTHFLPASTSINLRHFYYSITIGVFFLAWFFGAIFISRASDYIGRKKALAICLCGLFFGYFLTVISLYLHSLSLLILGRIVAGLTAGNQSIAQAAIIDISTPGSKAKNLGLTVMAFSLGMVLGPLVGGVLSDNSLSPLFNFKLPFYFLLVLILSNLFLLVKYYNESLKNQKKFTFRLNDIIHQFSLLVTNRWVKNLSIIFFVMQFCFNTFYIFIAVYLLERFHFTNLNTSVIMLILGIANAFSSAVFVPLFHRHFTPVTIVKIGLTAMAISLLLLITMPSAFFPYLIVIPFMLGFALAYTTMLTLFSNAVTEEQQGWVMGLTVSLFTSGSAITSLMGGNLMDLNIATPMVISIVGFAVSFVLVSKLSVEHKAQTE